MRDAAVLGRPNQRFGEEVVAVVVLESGHSESADELIASCAKQLARFKLPRAVVFISEIQRGPAGKVNLRWLRKQVTQEFQE